MFRSVAISILVKRDPNIQFYTFSNAVLLYINIDTIYIIRIWGWKNESCKNFGFTRNIPTCHAEVPPPKNQVQQRNVCVSCSHADVCFWNFAIQKKSVLSHSFTVFENYTEDCAVGGRHRQSIIPLTVGFQHHLGSLHLLALCNFLFFSFDVVKRLKYVSPL